VHLQEQDGNVFFNEHTNTHVCYFNGVGTSGMEEQPPGLMGGFLDLLVYCASGAVASDLPQRCQEAYRFIAEHYKGPESRIWLFGLSRGAYTVRAVAGMINNCGIIKLPDKVSSCVSDKAKQEAEDEAVKRVEEVWDMFWDDKVPPRGEKAKAFRRNQAKTHPLGHNKPPIVFMGLLDTVGAAGLPTINPRADGSSDKPVTYRYRPFRDLRVSGEVEHVFQACSTHDRLTPFEPCFVRRDSRHTDHSPIAAGRDQNVRTYAHANYTTEEVWYPGAHYDLGRQDFVFSNQPVTGSINRALNLMRTNVKCLPELADYPLVGYELDGPQEEGPSPDSPEPPCIVGRVVRITRELRQPQLLPCPADREAWQQLVKGAWQAPAEPQPADNVFERVYKAASAVSDQAFAVVRAPGAAATAGVMAAVKYGCSRLPLPLFQDWYTIDAETKILGNLAKVVSYVLAGSSRTDVVLKDRTIPLPGKDTNGGFIIPPAVFFPVPKDTIKCPGCCRCISGQGPCVIGNSYASYKPQGRAPEPWFMSKTYENYMNRIKPQPGQ